MGNNEAFSYFTEGRQKYLSGDFKSARRILEQYKHFVSYQDIRKVDNRVNARVNVSVIIVGFKSNESLIHCLESAISQDSIPHEIILIDNGGNENIHVQLKKMPILWVLPSINLYPSEGRNVGAHFARSNILIFLDDDAVMNSDYISVAYKAMQNDSLIALRGKIIPKNKKQHQDAYIPKHYDLGGIPIPSILDLEGNTVIRKDVFNAVGGFDPLMFGHEGKELSMRCNSAYPEKSIYYWPSLVIKHDYAEGDSVDKKMSRQKLANRYINYLEGQHMKSGVSIVIKDYDGVEFVSDFFDSLIKHNSFKPVEVIYCVSDPSIAIGTIRPYISRLFIRIVRLNTSLSRMAKNLSYNQVIILNRPFLFMRDCLAEWLIKSKTDNDGSIICTKSDLSSDNCLSVEDLFAKYGDLRTNLRIASQHNPYGQYRERIDSNSRIITHSTKKQSDECKEMPMVSFILPIFNKVDYIEIAIKSILSLDIEDIECICVEDCSTDGSREVVSRLAQMDYRIKVIYNEINKGAGASRNRGIHIAKGKYLFFLDADDFVDNKAFIQMLEYALTSNADVVRGKITGVDPEGAAVHLAKENQLHNEFVVDAKWVNENSLWFYWYFSANLYKRKFLIENHISFPEGVRNEDPVFLCKTYLYANSIVLFPSVVYYYVITPGQVRRKPTYDFLSGWVRGYYSIYQMIQTQKLQTAYFLLDIPSLIQHTNNIVKFVERRDSIHLLDCVSVMFRNFDKYAEEHSESLRFKLRYVKQDHIEFARLLGSKTGTEIYHHLKESQ